MIPERRFFMERLDKLLAASGLWSRSEAKSLIRAGRVSAGGRAALAAEEKYDPDSTEILVDGQPVNCARHRYFMLHKPAGVLSATEDRAQETVLDLLPKELQSLGLFPVGRLDKDTTGLLILTNDGLFSHWLTGPRHHVAKVYRAAVDRDLEEADAAAFAAGLVLGDGTLCRPAELELTAKREGVVTVVEGKYHQIKRMFAARGKTVTALHRLRIGPLALDPALLPGQWRELTAKERALLLSK